MSELKQNELFRMSGSSYRVGEMNLDGSASGQREQQQTGAAQQGQPPQTGAAQQSQPSQTGAAQQSQPPQTGAEKQQTTPWCAVEKNMESFPYLSCLLGMMGAQGEKVNLEELEQAAKWIIKRYQAALTEIAHSRKHRAAEGMQESYRAFIKGGKGGPGRAPLVVNWEQYDHLIAAGLTMEKAAEAMGIGYSTLRRKVKERNK